MALEPPVSYKALLATQLKRDRDLTTASSQIAMETERGDRDLQLVRSKPENLYLCGNVIMQLSKLKLKVGDVTDTFGIPGSDGSGGRGPIEVKD